MALSVRLDAKTERLVENLAKKRGQTKSELIRDALGVLAERENGADGKKRPYDSIAHLIGCVDSGGARLSEKNGRKVCQTFEGKSTCPPFSLMPAPLLRCWIGAIPGMLSV